MKSLVLMLALLAAACAATPAFAYLDPGTGSMILQVILGGAAAAGVALKLYWQNIKLFFSRGTRAEPNAPENDE
jgi:hypothetical protein